MTRSIEYSGFKENAHKIIEHCGSEKFWQAIGRLSSWGLGDDCDSVATVRLFAHYAEKTMYNPPYMEIEISSANLRKDGSLIISIHAIWSDRDKSFSFHS